MKTRRLAWFSLFVVVVLWTGLGWAEQPRYGGTLRIAWPGSGERHVPLTRVIEVQAGVVPAIELLFQLHTRQDCPFHEQDAHSYPSRIGVV
jgi:hypothetical protein